MNLIGCWPPADGSFVSTEACNLDVPGIGPDICHHGGAYTVLQTVRRYGVYSGARGFQTWSKHPLQLIKAPFIGFFSNLISRRSNGHTQDFKTFVVYQNAKKIVFPNTKIGCSCVATCNSDVSKHSFLKDGWKQNQTFHGQCGAVKSWRFYPCLVIDAQGVAILWLNPYISITQYYTRVEMTGSPSPFSLVKSTPQHSTRLEVGDMAESCRKPNRFRFNYHT